MVFLCHFLFFLPFVFHILSLFSIIANVPQIQEVALLRNAESIEVDTLLKSLRFPHLPNRSAQIQLSFYNK